MRWRGVGIGLGLAGIACAAWLLLAAGAPDIVAVDRSHLPAQPVEDARQVWPPPGMPGFPVSGVAVAPDGTLLVLHRAGRGFSDETTPITEPVILRVDPATGAELARYGAGLFASPHGLSIAPDGSIWVTDTALNTVTRLSPEGAVLAVLGAPYPAWLEPMLRLRNLLPRLRVPMTPDTFARPTGAAPLAGGGIAVTDGYRNARLVVFDGDGRLSFEVNARGDGPGEFHLPHGITALPDGRLAVADRRNARLQVFSAKGVFLWQRGPDVVGRPFDVAVDSAGCLHVLDGGDEFDAGAAWGAVVTLSPEGDLLARRGGPGPKLGQFALPHAIAVGADGSVYVAELGNARVQALPPVEGCGAAAR
jgi:Streptogramin lyase